MRFIFMMMLMAALTACQQQKKNTEGPDTIDPLENRHGGIAINPYATVDISPMDMSYWPVDYPKLRIGGEPQTAPLARIIYSRPHLQGRRLFPDIIQYEQGWRLGANEATELQLFKDATIENQSVKAGRYTLYCIPHPDTWTFVLNSATDIWGIQEDHATDIARFEVPVSKTALALEYFTMVFAENEEKATLVVAWENWEARIQFKF
ncbi:MAG: DUF2911 domain-containing protein [Sphingomonadales bacterium]